MGRRRKEEREKEREEKKRKEGERALGVYERKKDFSF